MTERVRKGGKKEEPQPRKGRGTTTARTGSGRVEVLVGGKPIEVSPELEAAVQRAYKGMFQPLPPEMTTTQAAEFLDVSRPFVIKLIKRGELSCRMVGKHRRIATSDLQRYRETMFLRAKRAMEELAELSQGLGLDRLEGPPPRAQ
jgi:excisionase family DNA binding protein